MVRADRLVRVIRVEKMRGTAHDMQPHPYLITERGIEVFSKDIVLYLCIGYMSNVFRIFVFGCIGRIRIYCGRPNSALARAIVDSQVIEVFAASLVIYIP